MVICAIETSSTSTLSVADVLQFDRVEGMTPAGIRRYAGGRMVLHQRMMSMKASGVSVRSPGWRNSAGARAPAVSRIASRYSTDLRG